jgi:hypothetical protein
MDWSTIASLATAFGTLVLAIATFVSVRSSSRAARATERALLAGIRPVLASSRLEDREQKVGFMDNHYVRVAGNRCAIEVTDDVIYAVLSLRNVGNGLAVLDRWDLHHELEPGADHRDPETYNRLSRDIFVPAGDVAFWQGALRDSLDPAFESLRQAITDGKRLTVDILYGDHDGGQRTITRFSLTPIGDGTWLSGVSRHWNLDRSDPR